MEAQEIILSDSLLSGFADLSESDLGKCCAKAGLNAEQQAKLRTVLNKTALNYQGASTDTYMRIPGQGVFGRPVPPGILGSPAQRWVVEKVFVPFDVADGFKVNVELPNGYDLCAGVYINAHMDQLFNFWSYLRTMQISDRNRVYCEPTTLAFFNPFWLDGRKSQIRHVQTAIPCKGGNTLTLTFGVDATPMPADFSFDVMFLLVKGEQYEPQKRALSAGSGVVKFVRQRIQIPIGFSANRDIFIELDKEYDFVTGLTYVPNSFADDSVHRVRIGLKDNVMVYNEPTIALHYTTGIGNNLFPDFDRFFKAMIPAGGNRLQIQIQPEVTLTADVDGDFIFRLEKIQF